jgi:hypothetical protein
MQILTTNSGMKGEGNINFNKDDASNNSAISACVLVAIVTYLPSQCLIRIRGFLWSHCLSVMEDIFIYTD